MRIQKSLCIITKRPRPGEMRPDSHRRGIIQSFSVLKCGSEHLKTKC